MLFVLDNYDSFTYNIVQRFGEIDPELDVYVARNDQTTLEEIATLAPERIVISPGPCTPAEAGLSKAVIERFGPTIPILGVCLGHQCMAEVYGAQVVRAGRLMHGKVSPITHDGEGVFANLPQPFIATRYHSLIVPQATLTDRLVMTAWTYDETRQDEEGRPILEIMGMRHRDYPIHGVQFHPESFLTDAGTHLLANFLTITA